VRRSPALVPALALVAAGLVGCSDDGGGGDRLASGDDFSIEAALAELPVLPDSTVGANVVAYDLTAAAEANGAGEKPSEGGDELGDWLLTATGTKADGDELPPIVLPDVQVLGSRSIAQTEEIEDEIGWSVLDVDAVAEVALPPERFGVVTGDVDEDTLTAAGLDADDDGVFSVGEGEDGETNPEDVTAARPLGTPLRMAADGDRIAVASSTEAAAEWRDGEPETLAEDADLRAIAVALDEVGALSAFLTVLPDEAAYGAVGIGWSVEDGEARMTMVFAYDGEEAAEDGVGEIEGSLGGTSAATATPISDRLTVDEVVAEGNLVVAHVRPGPEGRPSVPLDMLFTRDGPFGDPA
jgi:hypothetical protein